MGIVNFTLCRRIAAHRAGQIAEENGLPMTACPLDIHSYLIESWIKGYEYSATQRLRKQEKER